MRLSFLIGGFVVAVLIILTVRFWPGEQAAETSAEPAPAPVEAPVVEEIVQRREAVAPVEQVEFEPESPAPVEPQVSLPELHESDANLSTSVDHQSETREAGP